MFVVVWLLALLPIHKPFDSEQRPPQADVLLIVHSNTDAWKYKGRNLQNVQNARIYFHVYVEHKSDLNGSDVDLGLGWTKMEHKWVLLPQDVRQSVKSYSYSLVQYLSLTLFTARATWSRHHLLPVIKTSS